MCSAAVPLDTATTKTCANVLCERSLEPFNHRPLGENNRLRNTAITASDIVRIDALTSVAQEWFADRLGSLPNGLFCGLHQTIAVNRRDPTIVACRGQSHDGHAVQEFLADALAPGRGQGGSSGRYPSSAPRPLQCREPRRWNAGRSSSPPRLADSLRELLPAIPMPFYSLAQVQQIPAAPEKMRRRAPPSARRSVKCFSMTHAPSATAVTATAVPSVWSDKPISVPCRRPKYSIVRKLLSQGCAG